MLITIGVQLCQIVHLSAHNSLTVLKAKVELDSHAGTCVVGDLCLIVYDHNRPVISSGYDTKARLKHAHIVNATVAYTELETG